MYTFCLQELPAGIEELGSRAKAIDATNNQLTVIPKYIGSLTGLQRLVLTRNNLTSIPPEIGGLSQLKVINRMNWFANI